MNEKTLIDFVHGRLHREKHKAVVKWLGESEENRQRFNQIKARETTANFNTPHLDVDRGFDDVQHRLFRQRRNLRIALRTAAAVLLLISIGLVWRYSTPTSQSPFAPVDITYDQTTTTDRGENHEIVLPDGSTVWLNADSKLTWKSDFLGGSRDIHLVGEAFFDVVSDPGRPFIVHTGNMDVKVLGTQFNVRAYPEDHEPVTTLVTGSVEITGEAQEKVTLRPMQTAVLDRSGERFEIFNITKDEAAPWREGKLVFRDTPLEQVIRDIERKYDVECHANALDMKDFLFTGTFDNLTIEEVLRVLKISSNIDSRIEGDQVELY